MATAAQVDKFEGIFNQFAEANFAFRKAHTALKGKLTADESLRPNDFLLAVRTEQHTRPKYAESAIAKDSRTQEVIQLAVAAQQLKKSFRDVFSEMTGDEAKYPKGADRVIGQVDEISLSGRKATTSEIQLAEGELKTALSRKHSILRSERQVCKIARVIQRCNECSHKSWR
jgi:hypothetical protein